MTQRRKITTPEGTFPVFSNSMAGGGFVASVLYFLRRAGSAGDATDLGGIDIKHHTEPGDSEDAALEALRKWCEGCFGHPCSFT